LVKKIMKQKTIIITGIVAVVFIALLFWMGQSAQNAPAVGVSETENLLASIVAVDPIPASFDFGNISMARGSVSREFTVRNTSSQSVAVAKVYTSCMCTSATLESAGVKVGPFGMPGHGIVPRANATIPANSDARVTVTFDPAAHGPAGVGRIERTVYLEDESGATFQISIAATVTP
jgi:hypothetical protein